MSALISATAPTRCGDRYVVLLGCALVGYATLGKGFAYLGFAPLYVGEIFLISGCLVMLRIGGVAALLTTAPGLVLAATMAWTLVGTLPYVLQYGVDAPRDSVIIMYGAFAFIVISLVLDDERRIGKIMGLYRGFLVWFVPTLPILFAVCHYARDLVPNVPGTSVPIIMLGPGEVPVHLAGAAVFAMAGFHRPSLVWILGLLVGAAISSVITRGGMLAFAIPITLAAFALGRLREAAFIVVIGLSIFAVVYGIEAAVNDGAPPPPTDRSPSATQLARNVASIFGSKDPLLEGTKTWRLEWWGKIVDDTVHGDNFWTGRGYGVNLAIAFGYGDPRDAAPLRSPHNAAFTILARGGVPGLVLWMVFLMAWGLAIGQAMISARLRGEIEWFGLFLWIGCFALGFVINAMFDVALEGPMQGIWFWCVIGYGLGAIMIYRFRHHVAAARSSPP